MSLELNGTVLNLKDKENEETKRVLKAKEEIKREYGFPITLKFLPKYLRKDPETGKTLKPAGYELELHDTIATKDGGTEEWRYFENKITNADKTFSYNPSRISFTGSLRLSEEQFDLAFFFIYISRRCANGKNTDAKAQHYFVIENKVKEATQMSKKIQLEALVKTMIFSPELHNISDKDLRSLAKAYFISNVDSLQLVETQMALWKAVDYEEQKGSGLERGYDKFRKLATIRKVELERFAMIQNCVDLKVLRFDTPSLSWEKFDKEGIKQLAIFKVRSMLTKESELAEFLEDNQEVLKDLVQEYYKRNKELKAEAKKEGEEPETEETIEKKKGNPNWGKKKEVSETT